MTYIIDILLLAIFALTIVMSAKKGFFMGLFDLIGSILSFIIARGLASSFAPGVYESMVKPGAEQYLNSSLSDVGTTDYVSQIEQAVNSIPDSLSGIMQIIGFDKEVLLEKVSSVDLNGDNLVESVMNTVVEPVASAVIQLIIFAVLAVALIFVLRIAAKLLNKIIKKLPVIKRFNSLFGAIFGILRGALIVCVVAALISVVAGFTTNEAFIQSAESSVIISTMKGFLASISGITL